MSRWPRQPATTLGSQLGPVAALVPAFVSVQMAECVLSKDGAGCPPPSPEVPAGHMLRRKGGQGWEENELLCFPIGFPQDTPAAGSMTSQPQALVTGETEASCECLSSGRKETNRACLCKGRGIGCPCDYRKFYWTDGNMHAGSLADTQGCRDPRVGQGCASCRLIRKEGCTCWFRKPVLELVLPAPLWQHRAGTG